MVMSSSSRTIAAQLSSSRIRLINYINPKLNLQKNSVYTTSKTLYSSTKKPPNSIPKRSPVPLPVRVIENKPSSIIWARPTEIPWQSKLANSVNLIGRLQGPVNFQISSDGKNWAATIINLEDSTSLRYIQF